MTTRELGRTNFEATIAAGGIVIVDAWASWCGPCRAFAPIFEAASTRHQDVSWVKLDTGREQALAQALDIRAIPTLLVFRDGVLLHQQAGVLPAAALDRLIEQARRLDMNAVRAELEATKA